MTDMRRLIETVSLNESEGPFTPAINAALEVIEKQFERLQEAVEEHSREYAEKLSREWPGCIVAAYQGHGMPSVKILISDEMLERTKTDDDYYSEVWTAIGDIHENNPVSEMSMELDNVHRNAIGDYEVCYRDGQLVAWNEFMRRSAELGKVGWGSSNL
jgi:hypothetical protein